MVADGFAAQLCLRDAWPSFETAELGGWLLRTGHGGYNRINSVWPGRFTGEVSCDDAIDRVEAFYQARKQTPRFQILDISEPSGLDQMLEQRGYLRQPECSDMWKAVTPVAMPADASVAFNAPEEWVSLYAGEQSPERAAEFPRILELLPGDTGFVVCRRNGRAAGVALVGRRGTNVAIDCVVTRPEARRSGVARSVMTAAEAWAATRGASRLLLSVVNDNAAALPLYLQLGYRKFAAYHYRYKAG